MLKKMIFLIVLSSVLFVEPKNVSASYSYDSSREGGTYDINYKFYNIRNNEEELSNILIESGLSAENVEIAMHNYDLTITYIMNLAGINNGTQDYVLWFWGHDVRYIIYDKDKLYHDYLDLSSIYYDNSYDLFQINLLTTSSNYIYRRYYYNGTYSFDVNNTGNISESSSPNGNIYYSKFDNISSKKMVYSSSLEVKFTNQPYTFTNFKYNKYFLLNDKYTININNKDYEFLENDLFIKQNGSYNIGFTFNETIDGSSIGKVQINFKIPENLNNRDTYLFDLDVNSLSMLANDYSPNLYLKYGNIFDDNLITQVDVFTDYEEFEDSETLRTYTRYFGNFGADIIYNNTYDFITLTLDFSDYINNYALNFTSSLDFDVQYTSREDEEQFYHTIDMTNKYALYLIPKVINTDIYTSINLYGNYDLYSIKDYTNSKSDCSYLKNIDISFSNIFSFLDHNNALKFINLNFTSDNNSTISFDSRLFDYTIQNTENENVKISNSNTGEIVNSNVIDTIVTEKQLEELEKDNSSSIFYEPIKFVTNKFPILEQSMNIYKLYSSYNYQETKPNFPKISLSFMGIDKEFETIDLSFYEEYRDLIFSYSKLTMALLTLLKVVKNVKNSFGGGE